MIDVSNRDELIFGRYEPDRYFGGVRRFAEISPDVALTLIDLGFLNRTECQNDSPTAGEMVDFVQEHGAEGWYLHGYAVSPDRADCRVTLEGIGFEGDINHNDLVDFVEMFRCADEFVIGDNTLYCWYD